MARRLLDYWSMNIFTHPFPGDARVFLPRLLVGLYHHELAGLPALSVGEACKTWMDITHPTTITKFVKLAEDAGYAETFRDEARDKRKLFIQPAERLRSEFKAAIARVADQERDFFAAFNQVAPTGDGHPEFERLPDGQQNDDANDYFKELDVPRGKTR